MENTDIVFCQELQEDLLNGATIIWKANWSVLCTILVRLPKDKFEKVEDEREFEYKQYSQQIGEKMYHAVHRNGTKIEVIKITKADHSETNSEIKYAIEMQAKRKESAK